MIGGVSVLSIDSQSSAARLGGEVSLSFSRFCSFFGSVSRRTLSHPVVAQIQADPSLAKLVEDGLLKWDDLLGKNPEPGNEGHVSYDTSIPCNLGCESARLHSVAWASAITLALESSVIALVPYEYMFRDRLY